MNFLRASLPRKSLDILQLAEFMTGTAKAGKAQIKILYAPGHLVFQETCDFLPGEGQILDRLAMNTTEMKMRLQFCFKPRLFAGQFRLPDLSGSSEIRQIPVHGSQTDLRQPQPYDLKQLISSGMIFQEAQFLHDHSALYGVFFRHCETLSSREYPL